MSFPSLADGRLTGWIHFPNTRATTPCIHDFYEQSIAVSLPVDDYANEVTCAWQESKSVKVEAQPPRAALLTGKFSPKQTVSVSYTVSHPKYLFGETTYTQTARYCPQPKDEDEDKPWYNPSEGGDGGDGSWEEEGKPACCRNDDCSVYSPCKCICCCFEVEIEPYDQAFDAACPEHAVPYDECAYLHEEAYTNAVHSVMPVQDILRIRDPLAFKEIPLTVPTVHQYCCPCPSHATNYVAASYTSSRLRLLDEEGAPFEKSTKSCTVRVAGFSPSTRIGDAALSFSSNGKTEQEYKFTVFGLAISHPSLDLAALNTLAPNFGLPLTVSTNFSTAAQLRLVTNVGLPTGNVHLSLENTTGTFTVWYRDSASGEYRKLLDSVTQPMKNLSLSQWRALMKSARGSTTAALPVYVTSSQAGSTCLLFRYWDSINGFLQDEVRQTLTSVLPCIQADINHDGKIDEMDRFLQTKDRLFRFWYNDDTEKGDYVGQIADSSLNASDLKVNGKADLVNFFTVKIDLGSLYKVFGSKAQFTLKDTANCMHYCVLKDFLANSVFDLVSSSVYTQEGTLLENAALSNLGKNGINLKDLNGGEDVPYMLALEAAGYVYPDEGLTLVVSLGGQEIYREQLKSRIQSIDHMFRNVGLRGAEENSAFVPYIPETPYNRPDDETDGQHIIFVPGYNVNEEGAQQWGRTMFKRLWWAGFRGMFTVVDWRGDYSQVGIPGVGNIAVNYYQNVNNAFSSAQALSAACAALSGEKTILAHSLGNVLASAAIKDYGLTYNRYYMLNAAVPMEAYDATIFAEVNMIPKTWQKYSEDLYSANWHKNFSPEDGRSLLNWQGRFAGIANAINCYSPTEDILANAPIDGAGGIWAMQELLKGQGLAALLPKVKNEAGWGFNSANTMPLSPKELLKTEYTQDEMMVSPPFKLFAEEWLHTTNSVTHAQIAPIRSRILADGIPAVTFAAGANPIDGFLNVNMQGEADNGWPQRKDEKDVWQHSDIRKIAYFYVHKLFKRILKGVK